MARGESDQSEQLARMRIDVAADRGDPQGYAGPVGHALEQRGDEQAPFNKNPPFPSLNDLLVDEEEVEVGIASQVTEPVDVEAWRILTLYISYTPSEDGGLLSLVPQGLNEHTGEFVTLGVVDPTLTEVVPALASRTMFLTELRTAPVDTGVPNELAVQFDVGPYKQVRFLFGEDGDQVAMGGALTLHVSTNV